MADEPGYGEEQFLPNGEAGAGPADLTPPTITQDEQDSAGTQMTKNRQREARRPSRRTRSPSPGSSLLFNQRTAELRREQQAFTGQMHIKQQAINQERKQVEAKLEQERSAKIRAQVVKLIATWEGVITALWYLAKIFWAKFIYKGSKETQEAMARVREKQNALNDEISKFKNNLRTRVRQTGREQQLAASINS